MIAICVSALGNASAAAAAASAIGARSASHARPRAMLHTARATTATATRLSPWIQPAAGSASWSTNSAKRTSATAEGSVKPSHAATAPTGPARRRPIAIPTSLLVGPGSDWQSATISAYVASSSHRRRTTYSFRKYARCAIGPPKDVTPRRSATRKTSSSDDWPGGALREVTWPRQRLHRDRSGERAVHGHARGGAAHLRPPPWRRLRRHPAGLARERRGLWPAHLQPGRQ